MGAETVRVKATHGKQKTCSHVTTGSSGGLTVGAWERWDAAASCCQS